MATLLNPRNALMPNLLGTPGGADQGQAVPRWLMAAVSATTAEPRVVRAPKREGKTAPLPALRTAEPETAAAAEPVASGPSYVRGVSLPSVLQMLHLERKTCLLEVTSGPRWGTLTLVNGELVDAEAEGCEGEDAAYRILAWARPHTAILDGVTLFRHTVKQPIAQLIVEAVRRQDETGPLGPIDMPARPRPVTGPLALRHAAENDDWGWLVEMLVVGGACEAAVFRAADEQVIARAAERVEPGAADTFTPLLRVAAHWARQSFPVVDDVTLRLGDRHALICPLGGMRAAFLCAVFASREAADFARAAIASIRG